MRRMFAIWWAHAHSHLYCLLSFLHTALVSNPELVRDRGPLMYIRYSVEPRGNSGRALKRTRKIAVGYWQRSMTRDQPDRWVDVKTFFMEQYDLEKCKWVRVK